jgi:serine/threonine-protein kinase
VDPIGKTLGNHRIVSCLGKGGMGAVYLAEHVVIGRKAAIKILHEGADADDATVREFFDEARAANQIPHRGIVDIYDCGQDDELGPYLVMEYLEGESLGHLLRRVGKLPPRETAHIIGGVADVLQAVHARGIVHRDLKPDNIFLAKEAQSGGNGDDWRIEVLDFGVARVAYGRPAASPSKRRLTGTPHYMSPEQCTGEPNVDHSTDIYALGVITYEMLTGSPPFDNRDHYKILAMHQRELPPPPRALNPLIPPDVEQVVLKALAKQPTSRYDSAWSYALALAHASGFQLPESRATEPLVATPQASGGPAPAPPTVRDPAPTTAPAPVQLFRRPCPHCPDTLMNPVDFGGLELDVCPHCRGTWFDQGEESTLAQQSLGQPRETRDLAESLGQRLRQTGMRCPCCEEPLVSYRFGELDDLEAEICELCGGLWLEHGELAHVQRARAREVAKHLGARRGASR